MKIMANAFIGATIAILSVLPIASAGPNLLTNGDFELNPLNANGWHLQDAHGGTSGAGASWATDYKHGGSYSAKEVSSQDPFFRQTVNVEANTYYTVSFWLKVECPVGFLFSMWTSYFPSNGPGWSTMGPLAEMGVGDWRKVEFGLITGPTVGASIEVAFGNWHFNSVSGPGTAWLDDISMSADAIQPLSRIGWKVSASHDTANAKNVIDGNPATRWSASGQPSYFMVDMGTPKKFSRIILDVASIGGHPRSYQIFVSDDGTNWGNPVASDTGPVSNTISTTRKDFSEQTKRYFKVVNNGWMGPNWWSIHELWVFALNGTSIKAPRPARATTETSGGTVSIYDPSGRLLKECLGTDGVARKMPNAVSLSFSPGVYFVKTAGGIVRRQALVR